MLTFNRSDSDWFFRRLNSFPLFAHHPVCPCFEHHLIRFGSIAVCLGCFCLTLGIVATVAGLVFVHATSRVPPVLENWWMTCLIGTLLYTPTLVQPFHQAKVAKIVYRTSLGTATTLLWYGAMVAIPWDTKGIVLKIVFCVVFISVLKCTLRIRARYTADPLVTCDRGCYPFCEGNQPRLQKLVADVRRRCDTDSEFVQFVEAFVNGDHKYVEVEHIYSNFNRVNGHVGPTTQETAPCDASA